MVVKLLQALDGFIIVFAADGRILYTSDSITSLLGYLAADLLAMTIYDLVYEGDHSDLYNILLHPSPDPNNDDEDEPVSFTCHCKRGGTDSKEEQIYELVQFIGHFRNDVEGIHSDQSISSRYSVLTPDQDNRCVFIGTGRLQVPQLIRELSVIDSPKSEFTSRHSLEWKFLFLDHRAPPIIGYLPFEVLGTSGYDYYHVDDLDKVVNCHEALMQKGEGTSCYYRFLTKGQQWIWLQTRFFITYHQWNSKPEFIVCTHRVVSYINVLRGEGLDCEQEDTERSCKSFSRSSPWSTKSSAKRDRPVGGSDTNSMSADSPLSRNSQLTSHSTSRSGPVGSSVKSENKSTTSERVPSTPYTPQSFAVVGVPTPSVISTIPNHRVDQLERRQEQLQQSIVEQQTELRQVTEQLLIAKYGLFSPVLNVAVPYTFSQTIANPDIYPPPQQVSTVDPGYGGSHPDMFPTQQPNNHPTHPSQ